MTFKKGMKVYRGLTQIEFLKGTIIGKAFICGGYARYCLSRAKNPIKATDIDIYCYRDEYYDEILKAMRESEYKQYFQSPRATTFKDLNGVLPDIQIIKPIVEGRLVTVGSIEDILDNFDFTVARAGLYVSSSISWEGIVDEDFYKDDNKNRLVVKNVHCPIGTINRIIKYSKKGYKVSNVQVIKMFMDWETRPQEYKDGISNLMKQLEGSIDEDGKGSGSIFAEISPSKSTQDLLNNLYEMIGGVD